MAGSGCVRDRRRSWRAAASSIAADGHPAFGRMRRGPHRAAAALSAPERADLADLGRTRPRRCSRPLRRSGRASGISISRPAAPRTSRATGADTPVLIVGGDDRLARYRHPMRRRFRSTPGHGRGRGRRAGLHVAATRFASAGPPDRAYRDLRRRVLTIEDAVLSVSRPGARYGDALRALDAAYARNGAPGEWAGHYQGGPIGFAQREFELAPGQAAARWFREPIAAGHAVAWNPSLPGGAKAEDTYLVTRGRAHASDQRAGLAGGNLMTAGNRRAPEYWRSARDGRIAGTDAHGRWRSGGERRDRRARGARESGPVPRRGSLPHRDPELRGAGGTARPS